jgi:hypothetical protein
MRYTGGRRKPWTVGRQDAEAVDQAEVDAAFAALTAGLEPSDVSR